MADEYHKDQIEHYKPKESSGHAKEAINESFDYAGGGGGSSIASSNNDIATGHKYHHHSTTPLIINTNSHMDMDMAAEYSKHSRELWVHEGA